jgi:hypothetical protein
MSGADPGLGGRIAAWIVALAVGRLPDEYRARYRGELAAELHDLTPWHRLGYAVRLLLCARALRTAFDGGEPVRRHGWAPPVWPHSRLYCRLRMHHHWRTVSVEDGTSRYQQCEDCGLEGDLAVRSNPLPMNRSFWSKNP